MVTLFDPGVIVIPETEFSSPEISKPLIVTLLEEILKPTLLPVTSITDPFPSRVIDWLISIPPGYIPSGTEITCPSSAALIAPCNVPSPSHIPNWSTEASPPQTP